MVVAVSSDSASLCTYTSNQRLRKWGYGSSTFTHTCSLTPCCLHTCAYTNAGTDPQICICSNAYSYTHSNARPYTDACRHTNSHGNTYTPTRGYIPSCC
ncbi:MAG: hypothetical protein QGH66_08600 [Dehalococcoidia bacterium]|nr:hypothetical protein [Dehalococcoidia bacterium]MDP7240946.1 hypothetical protein [Dehalococcoidia bacterium]